MSTADCVGIILRRIIPKMYNYLPILIRGLVVVGSEEIQYQTVLKRKRLKGDGRAYWISIICIYTGNIFM